MVLKLRKILIILVLFETLTAIESAVKGSIDLDSFTFEKVISKFKVSLVRIDTKYPVGEKQEVFTKLVNNVRPTSDLLIAEVGVEDFSPFNNKDLAEKHGVKRDNFPTLILFINGNTDKPIKFNDDYTFTNILKFIKKNSEINIQLNHCIPEFDRIVAKFISKNFSKDKQKKFLKEAKKKFDSLTDQNDKQWAQVYVKIMDKVIERGIKFIESEEQRVLNIMSGKVTETKRNELQARLNIIQSFYS